MLFSPPADPRHESEKERNLYAKLLVGYWFNELVPGVEERLAAFGEILDGGEWFGGRAAARLDPRTARVTTDFHAYRAGDYDDRGECADVLALDAASSSMVAVEAKLDSDFTYAKDVLANAARIRHVADAFGVRSAVQCLLVSKRKRDEAERQQSHAGSNWTQLLSHGGPPLVLVTWEQLVAHPCVDERVRGFVVERLRRARS